MPQNDTKIEKITTVTPLLTTKFFIPPVKKTHVQRKRLLNRLENGAASKLILVSAPAGFGKTTLLIDWSNQQPQPLVWLSLDRNDNEPVVFLRYLIATIQQLEPEIGKTALVLLQSARAVPVDSILVNLLNDLARLDKDFFLVLDDYYFIENQVIHHILEFLLENQPPTLHLILATRSDPPLPLARLRGQSQLVEIRAFDLCFSKSEIKSLFQDILKINLTREALAVLETRTEGWIAGLQMAALSLQGRENVLSLISGFKGDNRYIADYLVEEVLTRQSESIQQFLLQMAILERLTAPLCNAITQRTDSQKLLDQLEKFNLFIFPLDHERKWYRYHQLFSDLLRQRVQNSQKNLLPKLHQRAAEWLKKNAFKEAAIQHYLQARDFTSAIEIIAEVAELLWDRGEQTKLLNWLRKIPDKMLDHYPELRIIYARSLIMKGQFEAGEQQLRMAEQGLNHPNIVQSNQQNLLNGKIAVVRSLRATYSGDIQGIQSQTRKALELLDQRQIMWRSVAATGLGFAHGWTGDGNLVESRLAFQEAQRLSSLAGNVYFDLLTRGALAGIEGLQGNLPESVRRFENVIQLAEKNGMAQTGLVGAYASSLGGILFEMNHRETGYEYIKKGLEVTQNARDFLYLFSSQLQYSRYLFTLKAWGQLIQLMQEMSNLITQHHIPPWMQHRGAVLKGLYLLRHGKLAELEHWIEKRQLNLSGPFSCRREYEFLVLARYLSRSAQLAEARHLLNQLIADAVRGNRLFAVVEFRLELALVLEQASEIEAALAELTQALKIAVNGQMFQVIVDAGRPVLDLLAQLTVTAPNRENSIPVEYIARLRRAIEANAPAFAPEEALSNRELDVLKLIATGHSNQEIASQLFISLNTVRTHTKNINNKLNVHSRTRAVARARELGYLT